MRRWIVPQVRANGIDIEYEVRGPQDGRPLLLIMGLGTQMIHWPDGFVDLLIDRGHRVVRFDNRDSGLSTSHDGTTVDLAALLTAVFTGQQPSAPYLLDDMADDTAALLDALTWPSAHVVGASMGGMIGQALAIRHPERVRSLTSIMSAPEFVEPAPEMVSMLATPMPTDREAYIEAGVRVWHMLAGPGFPMTEEDDDEARAIMALAYDRHHDPEATMRQLAAILASEPRTAALATLGVPALVIHGTGDRLIPPIGGQMTAAAIPGAEHVVIEGMGHDLPRGAWVRMVDAISELTERADATSRSATA
jgi:pimeloyl-ACP methyl ester carboxylesterase